MKKNEFGVFEIVVPAKDGNVAIPHQSKIKVSASHNINRGICHANKGSLTYTH